VSLEIRFHAPAASGLASDNLRGEGESAAFFGVPPFDPAAYRRRLPALAARFDRGRREAAAAALHPTSDDAARRLARFVDEGGAVVTTGQQAGLFSGPLYTILKALTAVRLAAELERRLEIPVLPIFWVASEDHDWAEVDHTYVVDRNDRLRRLAVSSGIAAPIPMSERILEEDTRAAVDELARLLAGAEHADEVLEHVRAAYVPGATVAGAFRALLEPLLALFDVLLTDAADPRLKEASLPVLRRELGSLDAHERVLRDTAERLQAAGHPVQVPVLPGASNLFLRTGFGRERLVADARGWMARESGARFTPAELDARLQAEPSAFSPNVLLRPVVESHVFPVLAYVAGPGEMAYWAQLRGLFEAHDVGMPAVYPRASATLIEPDARERLDVVSLPLEALRRPRHELVRERARASVPPEVAASLRRLREGLVHGFDEVAAAASLLDPSLPGTLGSRRNRALLEVAAAETRVLRATARADTAWAEALDAATAHLAPLSQPHERVLNALPFLARHGVSLLGRIADAIEVPLHDPG
jgi:bacillithiol synthase